MILRTKVLPNPVSREAAQDPAQRNRSQDCL